MTDTEAICLDILTQMYEEAEPGLDFEDVQENPDDYGERWFAEHYLDAERQRDIVDEHIEDVTLTPQEETAVVFTTILNYGPSSVRSEDD